MRITLLQTDIKWSKPAENIAEAEALMAKAEDADLYVLPEMWSTGFVTDAPGEDQQEALQWMWTTAKRRHAAIAGSLAVMTEDGRSLNRQFFVKPDGDISTYDKHHLFKYGGEDRYYQTGRRRTVVEWRGVRFLLVTCYDLRFPVWMRYQEDYDAIICVANWPESRQNAWQILTRARAIENQAYLIGCNRVGNDDYNHYRGCSAVISPIGKTLACCKPNVQDTASFLLNLEEVRHKREKFKVLDERDIL